MTAQLAHTSYTSARTTVGSLAQNEYGIIARITARLEDAMDLDTVTTGYARLAEALFENRRLWLALASDVAHPQNALPAELRQRLFALAAFVQVHSERVLQGSADPADLVAINRDIMSGLAGADGSHG
ncbi:flagellar biosynthesis regulator FlaF [Roseobacter sp. HKCCA0434]|uniref:flagellar biosynthesis regulator FlaF n=1 Tax=Roseobacter sp. HKCCA0434 TaxID=3079297 RepID=UPI002905A8CC|nr:flagellar biosynthesis regulator FlaF [Roseobacter sp. HKCCA0434]